MPFSSWLLGAMYAPSPTSALLHSSTMVKAGVFLLLRLSPAMAGSDGRATLVAFVGLLTFLFVSLVAVTEQNTKKVLAYSTIGSLGLIVGLRRDRHARAGLGGRDDHHLPRPGQGPALPRGRDDREPALHQEHGELRRAAEPDAAGERPLPDRHRRHVHRAVRNRGRQVDRDPGLPRGPRAGRRGVPDHHGLRQLADDLLLGQAAHQGPLDAQHRADYERSIEARVSRYEWFTEVALGGRRASASPPASASSPTRWSARTRWRRSPPRRASSSPSTR